MRKSALINFHLPANTATRRDEQEAWQKTAIIFDQSFHMTDYYFEGPDTYRLLSDLGVNSLKNFGPNKAKQFVACNYDGYVIDDAILCWPCREQNQHCRATVGVALGSFSCRDRRL